MASVFLSYSREDVAKAQAVATALEGLGHSVWWDRQLHGGSRFSKEIEQALKNADVVLVLWSRASVESAWVQDEAAEGRDTGRLVPAVIDDSKPPLGFRQYQAIDLSARKRAKGSAGIAEIDRAIRAKGGEAPAERTAAPLPPARDHRRLGLAAAAIAVVAIAVLVYAFAWPGAQSNPDALRLRLGTFESLSKDVPQSIPGTLREELLAALGTDAVLVVTTSGQAEAKSDGGYALNVSVREADAMLRFAVHVVNEKSGASVWSETLDRSAVSMDLAPRQVAVSISQVLRCGLGGAARYGKAMPDETLTLYFNFCEEYWADTMGKEGSAPRALDLARRLVAAAPDFSRGWSGLGQVAVWATRESPLADSAALRAEAQRAAEKALKLDPENSQAYEVLAILQPPFAFAEREKLHLKSISVRPGDCGCEYVGYGAFLSRVGRNDDAVDAFKRAHDMIPLSADVNATWAEALFVAGRVDQAQAVIDRLLELWPDNPDLREILLRSAFWTGRHAEAARLLDDPKTPLTEPERKALRMAMAALQSGNNGSKAAAAKALVDVARNGESGPLPIVALAALGAGDQALPFAAQRIEREGPRALPVLFEPPFEQVRHSPMFARIAQKFGLVDYWRASGKRPDFCSKPAAPALCGTL